MSRSLFTLLCVGVIFVGLFAVIGAVHSIHRLADLSRRKVIAAVLCAFYICMLIIRPSYWFAGDLAVIAGAVGAVLLFQGGLQTPGAVVVFLSIAAVIDLLSMSGGLSRMLVEGYRTGKSNLLVYLSLAVPIRGRLVPVVGIGDFIVAGAAAIALLRLGIGRLAVLGTIACGLLAALAWGLWRGATPALPFIAVAVIILVWRFSANKQSSSDAESVDAGCRDS